jgi:hypothetical protein
MYIYCIRRFQLHIAGDVMSFPPLHIAYAHSHLTLVTHISRNTFSLYRTSIQGNGILTTYRAISAFNVDRFIKVDYWNENDALNEGVYQISLDSSVSDVSGMAVRIRHSVN